MARPLVTGQTFRAAFTIRSGEATYIGSFMLAFAGNAATARPWRVSFFIVADRSDRDRPIAQIRLVGRPLKAEVTDVSQFGSQALGIR